MITGHLPAGYLVHRATARERPRLLWLCLLGSVFPDVDLLYFYGPGHRHVLHHRYWPHLPVVWLGLALVFSAVTRGEALRPYRLPGWLFIGNVALHLCLDTIVGGIYWAWPLSAHSFRFFQVPAVYRPPILNFILHWTFCFEIAVWAAALAVFLVERFKVRSPGQVGCPDSP